MLNYLQGTFNITINLFYVTSIMSMFELFVLLEQFLYFAAIAKGYKHRKIIVGIGGKLFNFIFMAAKMRIR